MSTLLDQFKKKNAFNHKEKILKDKHFLKIAIPD